MEKKIKTLYILSMAAILAFLGMQVYWLYTRYDYSLTTYEERAWETIESTLKEYDKLRQSHSRPHVKDVTTYRAMHNLNTNVDSLGRPTRTATVSVIEFDARSLLGIKEKRDLTQEEKELLASVLADSLAIIEERKASFDVTSSPSDGMAWNAMRNFELEVQSPFTVEGIDTLLRKDKIEASISLAVTDSILWKPIIVPHKSIMNPHYYVEVPYSELERKSVVIECKIPSSEVLREMGWTLILAIILSLFLILCLVWQIQTIAKLTRLDKMRNSFITTMIHELKRPISTLKMCVSGIESDKMMEDEGVRREITGETRMALDNLSAYFSKLRDITFNDVEQIPLNISLFNLHDLTEVVLKSLTLPSGKEIVFENNVPGDYEVSADRTHIMNILTNLMENAVKYSGDEVRIKINALATPERCEIMVEDTGFGISPADMSKIFDRFFRGGASASDIPGMGLGLAYVKLLVDAHGGEISVESEIGVGSSFKIILPQ